MKQQLFLCFIALLIVIFVTLQAFADEVVTDYRLVPQHPRGIERITHFDPRVQNYGWEERADLEAPSNKLIVSSGGYAERMPRGIAVVSSHSAYPTSNPQAGVTINVRGLESSYEDSAFFEGWLVDEDTGYWLSLGVFNTDHFGNGRLNTATGLGTMPMTQKLYHSLDLYDAVAVTFEPYPDNDPRPAEDVVLYGWLPKKDRSRFIPPTTQNKLWGLTSYVPSSSYANQRVTLQKNDSSVVVRPARKYIFNEFSKKWISQ